MIDVNRLIANIVVAKEKKHRIIDKLNKQPHREY